MKLANFEKKDWLEISNPNGLTKIGYKRYVMKNSYKFRSLLVEAQMRKINPKHEKYLNTFEKYQILKQQIHTLLNMVPDEFINYIDRDPDQSYDFFQGLQLLANGKSLCHYNV